MTVNIYSAGDAPILRIRYMGFNQLPDTVNIGPMLRNSYIIHYVLSGKGYYNNHQVKKGQGFLINPGDKVKYLADKNDPWELLWVVSEDEKMGEAFSFFKAHPSTKIFSYQDIHALKNIIEQMKFRQEPIISCTEMLQLFLNGFSQHTLCPISSENISHSDKYIDFAIRFIHNNYYMPITIHDITQLLGISHPYFYKIFKSKVGISPKKYILNYKLSHAKRLLLETELMIGVVANSVGFNDPLTFSHFFSLREGCSPEAFRKANKVHPTSDFSK